MPGLFGYLYLGESTQSDVLSSFARDDILAILMQAAVFLKVSFSYSLVVTSLVGSLGEMVFEQGVPELLTVRQRAILIPAVNGVCILLGMFLKDIQPILGVGGALGGCIMVFTFPSVCRLKTTKEPMSTPRNIGHILLAFFGSASAVFCGYFSVLSAIEQFS
jgi:hypothetical protein